MLCLSACPEVLTTLSGFGGAFVVWPSGTASILCLSHCPPGLHSLTSVCLESFYFSASLFFQTPQSGWTAGVGSSGLLALSTLPTPMIRRHSVRGTPDLPLEPQAGVHTLLNILPLLSCVNTLPVP